MFRGPSRDLGQTYVAVLGGTECYGKFVADPFPAQLERQLGMGVANLACVNAGLDVYLNEVEVLRIAAAARVVALQVVGAQNLSNRYYAVHPRRNDRFLQASPLMQRMFPEVDFTEFNFTRHMLSCLQAVSADRFEVVAEELRAAWVSRMRALLGRLPVPVVLFWVGIAPPPQPGGRSILNRAPLFVDREMIATVRPMAMDYLEISPSVEALAAGVEGMAFAPLDLLVAQELPGPRVHQEIAAHLGPRLMAYV